MECNVCLNEWDEERCVPRMLPCGHSYCGDCLTLLFKQSNQEVSCPKCMTAHKLVALDQLNQAFPKNWALIALADSHKPTAPLLQMRMGTPQKRTSLRSKLFQSLSAGGGGNLNLLYSARQRGSSDMNISNSSTFMSALSGSLLRRSDAAIVDEEYKSDEEVMRRIAANDSESCQSGVEDDGEVKLGNARRQRKGGRARHFDNEPSDEDKFDSSASEISERSNFNEDDEEPFLEPEAICREHHMKIHSWHKKTRKQLCTHCIQSTNLANEPVVQVYSQAVREIKTRMLEAKELNKLRKMQLTQVMGHLTETQRKNRQTAETKLTQHLGSMRKIFEDYVLASKMQLAQAFKRQDLKVSAIEQRVGEDLDQLCNDDLSLQSMFEHEDLLLVYMTQAVDNLYTKTVNYRPSIEDFNDLVVNVHVEPEATTDLKQMLGQSQSVNLDALKDVDEDKSSTAKPKGKSKPVQSMFSLAEDSDKSQGSPAKVRETIVEELKEPAALTIDKLFLKDEHWLCTTCGQRQDGADIICVKCLKFKPITFYPNLAHNPANVTSKELKALQRRRKLERKLVIAAEKAGQSLQGKNSTTWYIISNKWLYKWKCFIQNSVTLNNFFDNADWAASITLSNNSDVGVLPAGLISNEEDLFEDADEDVQQDIVVIPGKQLKKDLRLNINYRAVNPFVWYLYYVNYGGAADSIQIPQLPRESIDVYSRDMSKLIKIYWGEGKILPQIKLNSLQNMGKEVIAKFMHKRNKRASKDGSASKRHQRVKNAQSQLLCFDENKSEHTGLKSSNGQSDVKRTKAPSFISKLKLCALSGPFTQASLSPVKSSLSISLASAARMPASSFSQIEQLLCDDNDLSFPDASPNK